jgi:hypothetical protein
VEDRISHFEVVSNPRPALTFDNAAVRLHVIEQEPRYAVRWRRSTTTAVKPVR